MGQRLQDQHEGRAGGLGDGDPPVRVAPDLRLGVALVRLRAGLASPATLTQRGASLSASGSIGLSRNPSRSNGNTSQSATSPTGSPVVGAGILAGTRTTPAYGDR